MATVKTAISVPEDLLEELKNTAEEMDISRSRVFTLAVREFLEARENRRILEQLNRVYGEEPDEEERKLTKAMKTKLQRLTVREKW
ncbi:MAG: ribbon-helix-helix protein, CopG family [Candidatus Marinimicrobia bacterium]|nr:ribbon-helix-helix protein, CopG family [Candidatus Neomarinimicrobiota bacterium]